MVSRRMFLSRSALMVAGMAVTNRISAKDLKFDDEQILHKARKIHQQIFTLDSHCDTPLNLLNKGLDLGVKNDPGKTGSKIDFPRMVEGGLDASFFAVFLAQGKRDKESHLKAKEHALEIFNAIYTSVEKYPKQAKIALFPQDAYANKKKGLRSIFIGLENGYPIGTDLKNVEMFYNQGARYITLCHTSNNEICDSSTDQNEPEYMGLSDFGIQVVKEMNRVGMMVDVSHISDDAFYDVIRESKVPVIASHSSARAICNHPRNLDDNMLKALAENGGVVQLCILNSYIKEQPDNPAKEKAMAELGAKYNGFQDLSKEQYAEAVAAWRQMKKDFPEDMANVEDAVNHIDHMVKVAGIDHVGIGTDFDGGGGIDGFNDISEAGNITYEMVKRGYSKKDIEKIWGENFMRVFKQVQENKG